METSREDRVELDEDACSRTSWQFDSANMRSKYDLGGNLRKIYPESLQGFSLLHTQYMYVMVFLIACSVS